MKTSNINIIQVPLRKRKAVLAENEGTYMKAANLISCQHEFISQFFYDR